MTDQSRRWEHACEIEQHQRETLSELRGRDKNQEKGERRHRWKHRQQRAQQSKERGGRGIGEWGLPVCVRKAEGYTGSESQLLVPLLRLARIRADQLPRCTFHSVPPPACCFASSNLHWRRRGCIGHRRRNRWCCRYVSRQANKWVAREWQKGRATTGKKPRKEKNGMNTVRDKKRQEGGGVGGVKTRGKWTVHL